MKLSELFFDWVELLYTIIILAIEASATGQ